MKPIKTIGHSNHPIDRFVDLLTAAGVEVLVDVRSTPYSRRFPQFGRERLAARLATAGILYRYEGASLGGKPPAGKSVGGGTYETLAARPEFAEALDRLTASAADTTLCLMCAEKAPLDCHRTVLVSRRLAERGIPVEHLLADGRTEAHDALEDRLLAESKEGLPDLFTTAEDRSTRLARIWQARERAMRRVPAT
jgi:uncharacterized protein (DUF488 family)